MRPGSVHMHLRSSTHFLMLAGERASGATYYSYARLIPSPNIKPPNPPNIKYSQYMVHYNMLGVFKIRWVKVG